jgi:hypothetical protein
MSNTGCCSLEARKCLINGRGESEWDSDEIRRRGEECEEVWWVLERIEERVRGGEDMARQRRGERLEAG